MDAATFSALGLDHSLADELSLPRVINGRSNLETRNFLNVPGDAPYHLCPEALADSPAGEVRKFENWKSSKVYQGTARHLWIALPPAFSSKNPPPNLIVFNDGGAYLAEQSYLGAVRAHRVLNTLFAQGEIKPTVAVFINPGRPLPNLGSNEEQERRANQQRSLEYDSLSASYAGFLHDEVLPFVEQQIGCALTQDPTQRIICGISSGGICAFTVAWHRPDSFARVLSHCGSFTGIRGGHNYPYLLRTTERKSIRVFLQGGEGDIDNLYGNWPDANRAMAKSLAFAGYDYRFEFGTGGHNLKHGGALFADSLRWLLR